MNEYEKIIISINNILNTANSLDTRELKQNFLMQNAEVFSKLQGFSNCYIRVISI